MNTNQAAVGRRWLLSASIALATATAGTAASIEETEIHGFISQGYIKSSDNNIFGSSKEGSFEYDEAGINFSNQLTDELRLGLQLVARDLGDVGNNKPFLDWAYGDYRVRDEFGIRLGRVKLPWGFYGETSDLDFARNSIMLPQSVYDESVRDFSGCNGGGIYGNLPAAMLGDLEYEAVLGAVNIDADNPWIKSLVNAVGIDSADVSVTAKYISAGALRWSTPLKGLRLGASYVYTKGDLDATVQDVRINPDFEYQAPYFSAEFVWEDLTLSAEYVVQTLKFNSLPGEMPTAVETPEGYYVQAVYRFCKWFELGACYTEYYADRQDKNGDNFAAMQLPDYLAWQKDAAITFRFDINKYWLVKLEAHTINGCAQLFFPDNPDGFTENWQLYMAKTSFAF